MNSLGTVRYALLIGAAVPALLAANAAQAQTSDTPVATAPNQSPATGSTADTPPSSGQVVPAVGAAGAAAADDQGIGEVVVTAQRQASTVQKTPISIAVVTGEQLVSRGVTNLQAIETIEPTVKIQQGQYGRSNASIRGVSSSGGAVTLNFDGQYLTNFNGLMYDVSRVEVLKGPQGTLYGLNATAGAINVITIAPKLKDFSANGTVEIGNYDSHVIEGGINIPIGDTLAVRLSGHTNRRDGYRSHPGRSASDYANFDSGRASVLWQPFERFSARATVQYTKQDFGDSPLQGIVVSKTAATPAGLPPTAVNSDNLDPREWGLSFPGYNHGHELLARGQLSYDFDWAQLSYQGTYSDAKGHLFQSAFGTATPVLDYSSEDTIKNTQHEVRLGGNAHLLAGLKWQIGYFYIKNEHPLFAPIYIDSVTKSNHTVPFFKFFQPVNTKTNNAFYVQATESLTDRLAITGGLRYTKVNQYEPGYGQDALNVGPYLSTGAVTYTRTLFNGALKYDRWSWHAGIDFQATPRNLIYFSTGTSFKDGGFTQLNSYRPEQIMAYELGSKNRFLGGKLEINAALFYYSYKDQQVTAFLETGPGVSAATTLNAGQSKLKGGEVNVTWLATHNDTLTFSANYTDAKFGTFSAAQPVVPSPNAINVSLKGNRAPQSPHLILNAGLEHRWELGAGQIVANVNSRYSSSFYLDIYNLPGSRQGSYMQTDASVGYHAPDNRWDISAFVRNLENNNILNNAQYLVQGSGVYYFSWAAPRTYGVRAGFHF